MSVCIQLRCPAEDRVVGEITAMDGERIDERAFCSRYDAAEGYTFDAGAVKDGVQMLCPRCCNPLVFRTDGDDVYAVPGIIRIAEGGVPDGAAAR